MMGSLHQARAAAPPELVGMLEQPRREMGEDRWDDEEKEEIESLIRSRGPARPRVVINHHQRDENGSREQEDQQRRSLAELRERQRDLRNHPWVLAPWELPGRRGKIGMRNVRGQAMGALLRTYEELPPEIQRPTATGTQASEERRSSTGLDDEDAGSPEPDEDRHDEEEIGGTDAADPVEEDTQHKDAFASEPLRSEPREEDLCPGASAT